MRYFQKVIKLSGIDIAYSKGYSPHQQLSFASPLGIGITSEGEYLDLELVSSDAPEQMIRRLNDCLNDEIRILDFVFLPDDCKNAMSQVSAADYLIWASEAEDPGLLEHFADYVHRPSLPVVKTTKKSETTLDLTQYIYGFAAETRRPSMVPYPAGRTFYLQLAAGSEVNIKPDLLLAAYCADEGRDWHPALVKTHRLEVRGTRGEEQIPLLAFGTHEPAGS